MNATFQKNMTAIAQAITPEFAKSLGISQLKPVSERTVRIDLKTARADGTNRIKVTHNGGGTFTVKAYQLTELDVISPIPTTNLEMALKSIGTIV